MDHGAVGHGLTLYDELIRVPLLWRGPGVVARQVDDVVSLVDVAPTLLELLGIARDERHDGRSVAALLRGGGLAGGVAIAETRYVDERHAMRGRRFKVVRRMDPAPVDLLFDLREDPLESVDASGSHPREANAMVGALADRIRALRSMAAGEAGARLDAAALEELRELGYVE